MGVLTTDSLLGQQEVGSYGEVADKTHEKHSRKLPRDSASRLIIKETLAGYRRMNEFTEQELRRDLPTMTEKESRAEYEELCAVWDQTRKLHPDPQRDALLDQIHLEELVERRRLWNKIGCELSQRKLANASDI
jgi:hypothetical protein